MSRRGNTAKWSALAGLASGLSQGYIEDARAKRQASLLEIQNQFRQQENQANRDFQSSLVDKKIAADKALYGLKTDAASQFNWNDPNLYKQFSNVGEASAAGDPSLLLPRKSSSDNGIMSNFNLSQWTPDSARAFLGKVNQLISDGKSEDEAYRIAAATIKLVPKPETRALTHADRNKWVAEQLQAFTADVTSLGKQDMRDTLMAYGLPKKNVQSMGVPEMVDAYKKILIDQWPGTVNDLNTQRKDTTGADVHKGSSSPDATGGDSQYIMILQQARQAIASGADRQAVIQRLRDMGIPEADIGSL